MRDEKRLGGYLRQVCLHLPDPTLTLISAASLISIARGNLSLLNGTAQGITYVCVWRAAPTSGHGS